MGSTPKAAPSVSTFPPTQPRVYSVKRFRKNPLFALVNASAKEIPLCGCDYLDSIVLLYDFPFIQPPELHNKPTIIVKPGVSMAKEGYQGWHLVAFSQRSPASRAIIILVYAVFLRTTASNMSAWSSHAGFLHLSLFLVDRKRPIVGADAKRRILDS